MRRDPAALARLAFLTDAAAEAFAGDSRAALTFLETPRDDIGGLSPSQAAYLGRPWCIEAIRLLPPSPSERG